jgi:hypothetical protein
MFAVGCCGESLEFVVSDIRQLPQAQERQADQRAHSHYLYRGGAHCMLRGGAARRSSEDGDERGGFISLAAGYLNACVIILFLLCSSSNVFCSTSKTKLIIF